MEEPETPPLPPPPPTIKKKSADLKSSFKMQLYVSPQGGSISSEKTQKHFTVLQLEVLLLQHEPKESSTHVEFIKHQSKY